MKTGIQAENWLEIYLKVNKVEEYQPDPKKVEKLAFKYHRGKTLFALAHQGGEANLNLDFKAKSEFILDKVLKIDKSIIINNKKIAVDLTTNSNSKSLKNKSREINNSLAKTVEKLGYDKHLIVLLPSKEEERNRLMNNDPKFLIKAIEKGLTTNQKIVKIAAPPLKDIGAQFLDKFNQLEPQQRKQFLQKHQLNIRQGSNEKSNIINFYETLKPRQPIKTLTLYQEKGKDSWHRQIMPMNKNIVNIPDDKIKSYLEDINEILDKMTVKEKTKNQRKTKNPGLEL
jgi:hypothetical protein